MDNPKPKRTYKDSLFCSRFSNPKNLAALHEMISGISTSPEEITINTLKHALFSQVRNDISFLSGKKFMVLTEEQSYLNQNMPLRMLIYVTLLYRNMLKKRDFFKEKIVLLPAPEFIELYCGTKEQPPETKIRLSEAFPGDVPFEPSLELVVTRFNISYNEDIKKCCRLHKYKPIRDYSFFVHDVQRRLDSGEQLDDALAKTMEYCISHDIMRKFLLEHEQEVPAMYSLRYDAQAAREAALDDGRIEGRIEGEAKGMQDGIKAVIATAKDFSATKAQTVEQLMKRYSLNHDQASAAVQANW